MRPEASHYTDLIHALRRLIPHSLRQHNLPGLNISVAVHGQVILDEGFGYADLARRTPMTARHVTHAGSMSKLYTATAIMQLIEGGALELYAPVNRYLPDFQIQNPLGEREITLYDLLTHRSGINGGVDVDCDFVLTRPLSEGLRLRYQKPMLNAYNGALLPLWSARVGEKFQYSNLGTATLGYVVEKNNPEGLDFTTYILKHIMEPLGMASSLQPVTQDANSVPGHIRANFSTGYASFQDCLIPTPQLFIGDYPAGSLLTTPGDHLRLLLAFMNGGEYDGKRILKPESVQRMLAVQVKVADTLSVGLMWRHTPLDGLDFFGHSGEYMFGWSNISLACPQLGLALVVCANRWNMVGDRNSAGVDIARFIAAWLKQDASGKRRRPPDRAWAWQVSYVRGLLMVNELIGVLGVPSPLTDEMLDAMTNGARPHPGRPEAGSWDAEGFRAGVEDMRNVMMTPQAIQAFLESEACRVPYEELLFMYREIDPTGTQPLIPFMAA